jgi:predicted HTH transcriptional regulator
MYMRRLFPLDSNQQTLELNGFVRRSHNTTVLKELIQSFGGKLSRKGRSRNWRLEISHKQSKKLVVAIYQHNEPSWLWVAKLLAELKVSNDQETLLDITKENPSITTKELIAMTDCSVAEARKAIDLIEWGAS